VDDVLSSSGGKLLAPLFAERKKTKTDRNNNNANFDIFKDQFTLQNKNNLIDIPHLFYAMLEQTD
jgi:hypothetical protein